MLFVSGDCGSVSVCVLAFHVNARECVRTLCFGVYVYFRVLLCCLMQL
jgi:hypothetical protein